MHLSCLLFAIGIGLKCFDCDIESTHICRTKGIQYGREITCLNGEIACAKFVGGMIMELDIVRIYNNFIIIFQTFLTYLLFCLYIFRSFGHCFILWRMHQCNQRMVCYERVSPDPFSCYRVLLQDRFLQ